MMAHRKPGQLRFKAGFTILEIALVLGVAVTLILTAGVISSGALQSSKAVKLVKELDSLSKCCQQYYLNNSYWPQNVGNLYPDYLYTPVTANDYGYDFEVEGLANSVNVSSLVPQGTFNGVSLGPQCAITHDGTLDRITMNKPIPNLITGRLDYDKKHLYGE